MIPVKAALLSSYDTLQGVVGGVRTSWGISVASLSLSVWGSHVANTTQSEYSLRHKVVGGVQQVWGLGVSGALQSSYSITHPVTGGVQQVWGLDVSGRVLSSWGTYVSGEVQASYNILHLVTGGVQQVWGLEVSVRMAGYYALSPRFAATSQKISTQYTDRAGVVPLSLQYIVQEQYGIAQKGVSLVRGSSGTQYTLFVRDVSQHMVVSAPLRTGSSISGSYDLLLLPVAGQLQSSCPLRVSAVTISPYNIISATPALPYLTGGIASSPVSTAPMAGAMVDLVLSSPLPMLGVVGTTHTLGSIFVAQVPSVTNPLVAGGVSSLYLMRVANSLNASYYIYVASPVNALQALYVVNELKDSYTYTVATSAELHVQYRIYEGVPVGAIAVSSYTMGVSQEWSAVYEDGTVVSAYLQGVYENAALLLAEVHGGYGDTPRSLAGIVSWYADIPLVTSEISAQYGDVIMVLGGSQSAYGDVVSVTAMVQGWYSNASLSRNSVVGTFGNAVVLLQGLRALYEDMAVLTTGVHSPYEAMVVVTSGTSIVWDLRGVIIAGVSSQYNMTYQTTQALIGVYDVLPYNTVVAQLVAPIPLLDSVIIQITGDTTLTLSTGRVIAIAEAEVSTREGSVGWSATIVFTQYTDYGLLEVGADVVLDFMGYQYNFVVASKALNRDISSGVPINLSVTCISPAVKYTTDHTATITKVWDTDTDAQTIVESVLGTTVVWSVMGWTIPANRLSVSNLSPMEVAKRVVGTIGAVIEADKLGQLYVRSRYPTPVLGLANATPAAIFTDAQDNLSVAEDYAYSKKYASVRLSDTREGYADSISFVVDPKNALQGDIKVYLTPWRSNFSVRHTRLSGFSLLSTGTSYETLVEQVQVIRGVAQVSKPLYQHVSSTFQDINLGVPAFVVGGTDLTYPIAAETLVSVEYVVRYRHYSAKADTSSAAQILVETV